jgi:hypothetical protein
VKVPAVPAAAYPAQFSLAAAVTVFLAAADPRDGQPAGPGIIV